MPAPDPDPTKPDRRNVQGLVAYRYEQPRYAVLLFSIADAGPARGFLRSWLPRVPRGDQDPKSLTGPVLNFAFSWIGLSKLLAADPVLDAAAGRRELDWAFTDQTPDQAAVSSQLGFIENSVPANWWGKHIAPADIHLAVYLAFDDDDQATRSLAEIRASAAQSGLAECKLPEFGQGALSGYRPEGGFLHFGYRDGVTSPAIDWDDTRQSGTVDFREFLMGYPNDDYPVAPQNPGAWRDFTRDGSFACLAWISQDVAAFNRFLDANAPLASGHAAPGFERDWVAAKLLGRWPDGSPLIRHPERPPDRPDFDDAFDYGDDKAGLRCPLSSHIRVVNLRDQELTFVNQRRFPGGPPRFVRRGFSYGPKLTGTADDGVDRGVIGTFICARVNEQFYSVLRWIQKTDFAEGYFNLPYAGSMQDALFGNRKKPGSSARFAIPFESGEPARADLVDFITYKGVAVLFLPSFTALARLT